MARKSVIVLCILLVIPLLTGCGDSLKFWKKNKEVEVIHKKLPPFNVLFKRTVEMYNTKQYKDAINSFLFLRENYPQETAYQSRITLYLADSHFHRKEYPEAIANYQEFIKLYPTNPDVPYAVFQIGMSYYKQRRSYDRDASFLRKAIKNFKKVLEIAPPGVLTNESIRMITLCQRELTLHNFFIADFYMRTHHYQSALFRYENIIKSFPDLKIYDRAHLGIGKAYLKLKNMNASLRHLSFVARRYPNSMYGKEAWKLLQHHFKITSLDQLPVVTFPVGPQRPQTPAAPQKKAASAEKPTAKPAPAAKPPVKSAKVVKSPPAAPKPPSAAAAKPHVYFPKITKTQQKPSVTSPPARQVAAAQPAKMAPVPAPVEKSAPKQVAKPKKTAPKKVVTPAPAPKVSSSPQKEEGKVKKTAASSPSPSHPSKPVKLSQSVKSEKPSPEGQAPLPKKVASAPPAPPTVKKMVKTDTLPPEKGTPSSGLVGALDTRLPIHISSDHVETQQGKNSVRFYGKVVATQKDVTLKCDTLTATYVPGGKAIDKIVALGDVVITQLNKRATCGKAVFYNAARKIELEGDPVAWDGPNKVSGDKMILLLEKNEIHILGSKKKPSRLVIYPNKKPGLLKTPGQTK